MPLMFMVDIETQGTLLGTPILSVGVAAYLGTHRKDTEPGVAGIISNEYYPAHTVESHKRIRPETMQWWMDDPVRRANYLSIMKARDAGPVSSPEQLSQALALFQLEAIEQYNEAIPGNLPPASVHNAQWWCKGPHFDISHLDVFLHPYSAPWRFYGVRDYRTYLKEVNEGLEPIDQDPAKVHTAEGDACHQLLNLVAIKEHMERVWQAAEQTWSSPKTEAEPPPAQITEPLAQSGSTPAPLPVGSDPDPFAIPELDLPPDDSDLLGDS